MQWLFWFHFPLVNGWSLSLLALSTRKASNIYCGQNLNQPIRQQDTITPWQRTRQQTLCGLFKTKSNSWGKWWITESFILILGAQGKLTERFITLLLQNNYLLLFFIIDRYKELPQKILAWVKFLKFQSFKLSCPHDPCAVRMRPAWGTLIYTA